jgi:hypothetical protein
MNNNLTALVNQKNVLNKKINLHGNTNEEMFEWKKDKNAPPHTFKISKVTSHDANVGDSLDDKSISFTIPRNGILSFMLVTLNFSKAVGAIVKDQEDFFHILDSLQIVHEPHNNIIYEACPNTLINNFYENDVMFGELLDSIMVDSSVGTQRVQRIPIVIPQFNDLIKNSLNMLNVIGNLTLRLNFKNSRLYSPIANCNLTQVPYAEMDFMYPLNLKSSMKKQIRHMNKNQVESRKIHQIGASAEGATTQNISDNLVLRNRGFAKKILIGIYAINRGEIITPGSIPKLQIRMRNRVIYDFKDTTNDVLHFFSRSNLVEHNLVTYTQTQNDKPITINFGVNQTHHNSYDSGLSMNITTDDLQWNKDGELELEYTFEVVKQAGATQYVVEVSEEFSSITTFQENGEITESEYDHDPNEENDKQKVSPTDPTDMDQVQADQREKETEKVEGRATTDGEKQENITIKTKSVTDVKAPRMEKDEEQKMEEETKDKDVSKESYHKATALAE